MVHNIGARTAPLLQVTGGGVDMSVRAAYAAEGGQMPFTTKLMVVFNEHNMPKIDVEDHAFMKRLLLIEHRSLFCVTEEDFRLHSDEPYTFMAEPDIRKRIDRNATLYWMLEGAAKLRATGAGRSSRLSAFACPSAALCHDLSPSALAPAYHAV